MTCPKCDCFGSFSTKHAEISKCMSCGTRYKMALGETGSNTKAVRTSQLWG